MEQTLDNLRKQINTLADRSRAIQLQRYFKTGPGDYGEGDHFLGLKVPQARALARKFFGLEYFETLELLKSPNHEERLIALFILIEKYKKNPELREQIFQGYIEHTPFINNWDLVDSSSPQIIGEHLLHKPRKILENWINSTDPPDDLHAMWKKRIALLATLAFIRRGEFQPTLDYAEKLLNHPHDLIHKAAGWMLREVGKKSPEILIQFVKRHGRSMPRTMVRYAIERLPETTRLQLLTQSKQIS